MDEGPQATRTDSRLDIRAARDAIAAIGALDLTTATIEQVKELLGPVLIGHVVKAPRFVPGLRLFRIRCCERPINIRGLLYPPAANTPLGRANRPGGPVLYCSTAREPPFYEAQPTAGTTVTMARWVTTAPLLANHVGYTASALRKMGSGRTVAGWGDRPVEVPGGEVGQEVAEYLASEFTRRLRRGEHHFYKVTAAVAEALFADDLLDGLLYPAVAMLGKADNFALKTQFADRHLRFLKAEIIRVDAVREFAFDVKVLDTATELAENGDIRWKGRLDRWVLSKQGDMLTFTAENGEWVARDQQGNIVLPE